MHEGAIFAYNILPWQRKALLEFHYDTNDTDKKFTYLKAKDESKTTLQMRPSDSMTNFYPRLSAWVDLPPCGYKVFTLERDVAPPSSGYSPFHSVAESSFGLSSFKTSDGTQLLNGNIGLVVIEDKSDTWAHVIDAFRTELGRPSFVSSKVVENGPVTRVTRQTMNWRSSSIVLDIAEFSATDIIELRFVIDWHEHEQILKLEIPTNLKSPKIFAKVPGAVMQRTPNGNEEPYQDWVAVQGSLAGREHTIVLANNSTYSYDCLDGLLRTILVRSAPYARHNPDPVEVGGVQAWQDQGRQERTFWLLQGAGAYADLALDRRACELQSPAEYVLDSRHHGTLAWEQSYLEVTPDTVEVLSIKRSEHQDSMVLRIQERAGRPAPARIICRQLQLNTPVELSAWEIKTISISLKGGIPIQVHEVSILEI